MNRDNTLDIAKGLAIWFVVFGHIANQIFELSVTMITLFHMPTFIFISGYLFRKSIVKRSILELIKGKLVALFVPYIIWSSVSLLFNTSIALINGSFSKSSIMNEVVDIYIYSRSVWFLIELFIIIMVFTIGYLISKTIGLNLYLIVIIIWLCIVRFAPQDILALYKFKWLFPFFIAGYSCVLYKDNKKSNGIIPLLISGILAGVLFILIYSKQSFYTYLTGTWHNISEVVLSTIYYFISFVAVLVIIMFSELLNKRNIGNLFSAFGRNSVDIYVLHMFGVKAIIMTETKLHVLNLIQNDYVKYMVSAAFSVIIVLIIYILAKCFLSRINLYRISIGKDLNK